MKKKQEIKELEEYLDDRWNIVVGFNYRPDDKAYYNGICKGVTMAGYDIIMKDEHHVLIKR